MAFGTSATACGLSCLAAARAALLARLGWDVVNDGLSGAPEIKVVVPASTHVTIRKALQVLGFGWNRVIKAPVDEQGRIKPGELPELDRQTLLILQAGEVNTGEFDPFSEIIPVPKPQEPGCMWMALLASGPRGAGTAPPDKGRGGCR